MSIRHHPAPCSPHTTLGHHEMSKAKGGETWGSPAQPSPPITPAREDPACDISQAIEVSGWEESS